MERGFTEISYSQCLVSPWLGSPPVCTPPAFSSHQATYDNRNEYKRPNLPYLTITKTCFVVNLVIL
jgi:hypothetical protein